VKEIEGRRRQQLRRPNTDSPLGAMDLRSSDRILPRANSDGNPIRPLFPYLRCERGGGDWCLGLDAVDSSEIRCPPLSSSNTVPSERCIRAGVPFACLEIKQDQNQGHHQIDIRVFACCRSRVGHPGAFFLPRIFTPPELSFSSHILSYVPSAVSLGEIPDILGPDVLLQYPPVVL
jgi:hypothetical protein